MLRAAATAAWFLLPACGYLISYLVYGSDSADKKCRCRSSSSSANSSSRVAMIYSSKSALPSEWDKRQVG